MMSCGGLWSHNNIQHSPKLLWKNSYVLPSFWGDFWLIPFTITYSSLCFVQKKQQPLNWTIHGREIQLFCYMTNSRIVENENASVTWSILGINSYDAIFSNSLPVNYLLSSLCNWFRLVTDWFKPVLHNTYCFIIARKKWHFPFTYQF